MKKMMKSFSMRKRMTLSFAIPIILILIPINSIFYHFLTVKYEEKLQYSVEQASNQAYSFLTNYVQTMTYLSGLMENSGEIQKILSSEHFNGNRTLDVQYREYRKLNNILMSYELSNPIYRLGLYIPDEIIYSSNNYFFYRESSLKERDDYKEMEYALSKGYNYFALTKEKKSISSHDNVNTVAMFAQIYTDNELPKPLNICSVSIEMDKLVQVMKNANIMQDGIVYIVDQYDHVLFSSDFERVEKVRKMDGFPLTGSEVTWKLIQLGNEKYYMIRKSIDSAKWQMISLIPRKEYRRQQIFIQVFQGIMIVMITFLAYGVAYLLSKHYVERLTNLNKKMNSLQSGNLNVQLPLDENEQGDEIEEVYRNFNFMIGEVRRLMQEHYNLGKNVQVSELRALQSQINPHFLYNTLDLINWMAIDYCASDIETIVWNLSRFYRLSLNHGKSIISIREELEHVQMYVNIENFHFDNAITYSTDVSEDILELACLNIIIQPFVENAILHGIAEVPEIQKSNIEVTVFREGDDIVFHIKDDGIGMDAEQIRQIETGYMENTTKGYGIRNINFRIKLCFGDKYGVTYNSSPGQGTTAHIRIPALGMEEAEQKIL